jgi:hypothetical protein
MAEVETLEFPFDFKANRATKARARMPVIHKYGPYGFARNRTIIAIEYHQRLE